MARRDRADLWKEFEAAVDSGVVDVVGNPRGFPGVDVRETKQSKAQDSWVAADGQEIP